MFKIYLTNIIFQFLTIILGSLVVTLLAIFNLVTDITPFIRYLYRFIQSKYVFLNLLCSHDTNMYQKL